MQTFETAKPSATQYSRKGLWIPFGFTVLLFGMSFMPRVQDNENLLLSFWGACAGLLAWQTWLFFRAGREKRPLEFRFKLVRVHWVQAIVHSSLYLYWGYYWRPVYDYVGLLLAQVVFSYAFVPLLSWTRKKEWFATLGIFPIIFSTNLFLWFVDDWYFLQFALISVGYLGKELITWQKDGEKRHIFNPSGFSLSIFSLGLLLTGSTPLTLGPQIASTLDLPPYIFAYIFALGLIVQGLFSVTLTTLGAAGALLLLNVFYTKSTGVFWFYDTNIPIAVFLGLHLLVTDPSTSPKTELGRLIFGGLYGLAVALTLVILDSFGAPGFYDKLLCVPLLNLTVQRIDRFVRSAPLEKLKAATLGMGGSPAKRNLVYMSVWILIFSGMWFSGFASRTFDHIASQPSFMEKQCKSGRQRECERLVRRYRVSCMKDNAIDCNKAGLLFATGKYVQKDDTHAAALFSRSCLLGFTGGCMNAGVQFIEHDIPHQRTEKMMRVVDQQCAKGNGHACFLEGRAMEVGRGLKKDTTQATKLFSKACQLGFEKACKFVSAHREIQRTVIASND